jgi:site-specific DNA-methyltransferase (cytosine-N4-specific)
LFVGVVTDVPLPIEFRPTKLGTLYHGDSLAVLRAMPDSSVDTVVTSPPYFQLRDYGIEGQLGQETSPIAYLEALRIVFREVYRVLCQKGSLWLNIGDTYYGGPPKTQPKDAKSVTRQVVVAKQCENCGTTFDGNPSRRFCSSLCGSSKSERRTGLERPKSLLGLPWRLVTMLADDGWVLRNDIIWHKPNHLPTHVKDRLPASYEHLFHLVKQGVWHGKRYDGSYHYNKEAMQGLDDVWSVPTVPGKSGHPAPFPTAIVERPIIATCPEGGVVLDPFLGSGTVAFAAERLGRRWVGIELNAAFCSEVVDSFSSQSLMATLEAMSAE